MFCIAGDQLNLNLFTLFTFIWGVDHLLLKDPVWCGQESHGQCLSKEKAKEKKALIHSHRCVTPLLPQQKFTTELMTKGRAPMQPIVARRTMWRLWKANPSAPLTGWAFKQTRGPISPQGWVAVWQRWENLGRSPPLSPRPERWLGRHCQGRILSPWSGRCRLCSVRRWARRCPSEGRPGRWRSPCGRRSVCFCLLFF